MSNQARRLADELKKFGGFSAKPEIRESVNASIKFLEASDFKIPIKNTECPIPQTISLIITNPSLQKSAENLVSLTMNLIDSSFFGLKLTNKILQAIELYPITDSNFGLSLIQFVATSLQYYYKSLSATCSFLSITLSLIQNPIPIISSTAFASSQQMVSSLFELIKNYTGPIPKATRIALDKLVRVDFDNTIYKYAYLIINDLMQISIQNEPFWLRVSGLPTGVAANLWNILISSHYEFILSDKNLYELIEASVPLPIQSIECLSIYVTFITKYFSVHPQISISIYSYFLSQLSLETERETALLFFRSAFTASSDFLQTFFEKCDPCGHLFGVLFEQLERNDNFDSISELLTFSITTNNFVADRAPYEIALCASSIRNKSIIDKGWEQLLTKLIFAIRFTSLQSSDLVFNSIINLLKNADELGMEDLRSTIIRILCCLASKQRTLRDNPNNPETIASTALHTNKKGFLLKQKRILAHKSLLKLLHDRPITFRRYYSKLFATLKVFPTEIDPHFVDSLNDEEFAKICISLSEPDIFYLSTLSSILASNPTRFSGAWPSVRPRFFRAVESQIDAAAAFVLEVSLPCFSSVAEILELNAFVLDSSSLIDRADLRTQILKSLLSLIQTPPTPIVEGWSYVLDSAAPEKCHNEESMRAAFALFSYIVRNVLKDIADDLVERLVHLNFGFVSQKILINVSLSALELLWILAPRFKDELWIRALSDCFVFLSDERPDVATSAVDTCFSLLSSNAASLPDEIFSQFIGRCFVPVLMSLNSFQDSSHWPVAQGALLNIAHVGIAFYERFSLSPDFQSSFWPQLIEKQLLFERECKHDETSVASLQFYEELLAFKQINARLRSSLYRAFNEAVCFYVDHEPEKSLVTQTIGRHFFRLLSRERGSLDESTSDIWLATVAKICLTLNSSRMVHPSASKALDAVLALFPAPDGVLFKACFYLRSIITKAPFETVRAEACEIAAAIFEQHVPDKRAIEFMQLLTPALAFPAGAVLVSAIARRDLALPDANAADLYFNTLMHARCPDRTLLTDRLVALFPRVSNRTRLAFVRSGPGESALLAVWERFCDPSSSEYRAKVASGCFDALFDAITAMMGELAEDEERLLSVLSFMRTHSVAPRAVGHSERCTTWHLIQLMPSLIRLVDDPRPSVRRETQMLLAMLNKDIASVIGMPGGQ